MSNEYIDLPENLQNIEGNVWINKNNKHLRYRQDGTNETSWINPISTYSVGTSNKIKKGQPVSVGLISQLDQEASGVGDSAIVVTNPAENQWCIGLALEPGTINSQKIHVQSSGQLEYLLSNKDKDNYYIPPHSDTKFEWTYDDIGKPVFVSNKNPGELTLDIAEAAYNGGTIISVGRLADAPLGTENEITSQKILIEIQLSGDVRGVVDSTQFTVTMAQDDGTFIRELNSTTDKVVFVKIVDGKGYFVLTDVSLAQTSNNIPVGAIVATSIDGKIDLSQYFGKDLLVTRLGILTGNLGYSLSDIGKTAYLKEGDVNFSQGSDSVEFKVGVCIGENKFLVDCRFAKDIQKSEMVGTIKPVFGENLVDSGYALVDKKVHEVYDSKTDWTPLLRCCYAKDIFLFSKSQNGPFTRVKEGNWELEGENTGHGILSHNQPTYFKFRDLYYTITDEDGNNLKCACQIKYTTEGSPESQSYVWPEQCFEILVEPTGNGSTGGTIDDSSIRIDISHLVALGAYMDNNGQDIESYDIVMQDAETGMRFSPGFTKADDDNWMGYEWQIKVDGSSTYLLLVTIPDVSKSSKFIGVTWPIGQKITENRKFYVTVRRRPTQYNSIYLNQFPSVNPWTPHVDSGNNLIVGGNKVYFGGALQDGTNASDRAISGKYVSSFQSYLTSALNGNIASAGIVISNESQTNVEKVEQYIKLGENEDSRNIKWEFDFSAEDEPVVSLNAYFAPEIISKDLGSENLENVETYEKSALRLIRALQLKRFNFKDNSNYDIFVNKESIDDYNNKGYSKELDLFGTGETLSIRYNPSAELDTDDLKDLFSKTHTKATYLSNIGVLRKASMELDERLLKVERVLAGKDFSENPSDEVTSAESTWPSRHTDDYGLLRLVSWLKDNNIYIPSNDSEKDIYSKNGVKSILYKSIFDNYGDYEDKTSYDNEINQFINSDEDAVTALKLDTADSHLQTLWMNYKNLKYGKYTMAYTRNSPITKTQDVMMPPKHFIEGEAFISASTIVPFVVKNGYNWTVNKKMCNDSTRRINEIYGEPLPWPIYNHAGLRNNIKLKNNFFCNKIFGISDGTCIKDGDGYYYEGSTFPAQSLEGYIFDFATKLSYIRSLFGVEGIFPATTTWIRPYMTVETDDSDLMFGAESSGQVVVDDVVKESVYSAFQFRDHKLTRAFSLVLADTGVTDTIYANDQSSSTIASAFDDNDPIFYFDNQAVTSVSGALFLFMCSYIAESESTIYDGIASAEDDEEMKAEITKLFLSYNAMIAGFKKGHYGTDTSKTLTQGLGPVIADIFKEISWENPSPAACYFIDKEVTPEAEETFAPLISRNEPDDVQIVDQDSWANLIRRTTYYANEIPYEEDEKGNKVQKEFAKSPVTINGISIKKPDLVDKIKNVLSRINNYSSDIEKLFPQYEERISGMYIQELMHNGYENNIPSVDYWDSFFPVAKRVASAFISPNASWNKYKFFVGFRPGKTANQLTLTDEVNNFNNYIGKSVSVKEVPLSESKSNKFKQTKTPLGETLIKENLDLPIATVDISHIERDDKLVDVYTNNTSTFKLRNDYWKFKSPAADGLITINDGNITNQDAEAGALRKTTINSDNTTYVENSKSIEKFRNKFFADGEFCTDDKFNENIPIHDYCDEIALSNIKFTIECEDQKVKEFICKNGVYSANILFSYNNDPDTISTYNINNIKFDGATFSFAYNNEVTFSNTQNGTIKFDGIQLIIKDETEHVFYNDGAGADEHQNNFNVKNFLNTLGAATIKVEYNLSETQINDSTDILYKKLSPKNADETYLQTLDFKNGNWKVVEAKGSGIDDFYPEVIDKESYIDRTVELNIDKSETEVDSGAVTYTNKLKNTFDEIYTDVNGLISSINANTLTINDSVSALNNNVATQVGVVQSEIRTNIDNLKSATESNLSGLSTQVYTDLSNTITNINTKINTSVTNINTAISNDVNGIINAVNSGLITGKLADLGTKIDGYMSEINHKFIKTKRYIDWVEERLCNQSNGLLTPHFTYSTTSTSTDKIIYEELTELLFRQCFSYSYDYNTMKSNVTGKVYNEYLNIFGPTNSQEDVALTSNLRNPEGTIGNNHPAEVGGLLLVLYTLAENFFTSEGTFTPPDNWSMQGLKIYGHFTISIGTNVDKIPSFTITDSNTLVMNEVPMFYNNNLFTFEILQNALADYLQEKYFCNVFDLLVYDESSSYKHQLGKTKVILKDYYYYYISNNAGGSISYLRNKSYHETIVNGSDSGMVHAETGESLYSDTKITVQSLEVGSAAGLFNEVGHINWDAENAYSRYLELDSSNRWHASDDFEDFTLDISSLTYTHTDATSATDVASVTAPTDVNKTKATITKNNVYSKATLTYANDTITKVSQSNKFEFKDFIEGITLESEYILRTPNEREFESYSINNVDNFETVPIALYDYHLSANNDDISFKVVRSTAEADDNMTITAKIEDMYNKVQNTDEEKLNNSASETVDFVTNNLKFKDGLYIYGKQLPQPDSVLKLNYTDVITTTKLGQKEGPSTLELDNTSSRGKNSDLKKVYTLYTISNSDAETYMKSLYLTFNGVKYKVERVELCDFNKDSGQTYSAAGFIYEKKESEEKSPENQFCTFTRYFQKYIFKFEITPVGSVPESVKALFTTSNPKVYNYYSPISDEELIKNDSNYNSNNWADEPAKEILQVQFSEEFINYMIKNSNIFVIPGDLLTVESTGSSGSEDGEVQKSIKYKLKTVDENTPVKIYKSKIASASNYSNEISYSLE